MDEQGLLDLVKAATAARDKAYAPYSGFKVGAAVLSADQNVFTGCNVENASFGASLCAERVALVSAVSEGHREVVALAVVTDALETVAPCGICLQVLTEFGPKATVVMANLSGDLKTDTVQNLLPFAFTLPEKKE